MKKLLLLTLLLPFFISGCKKESGSNTIDEASKVAPDGFDYSTTSDVNVTVKLLTNNNEPITGTPVEISYAGSDSDNVFKAISNEQGSATFVIAVPTAIDTLIINPNTGVGKIKALIQNHKTVNVTIGGPDGFSGDIAREISAKNMLSVSGRISTVDDEGTDYVYPDGGNDRTSVYQPSGKPHYLESNKDAIDASLLSFINNSIPEGQSVPSRHPEYLSSSALSNLDIQQESDVWMTFVFENAAYLNTIAYYTYPTNHPPRRTRDIKKVTLVFPNASNSISKVGDLASGDKVKLGHFQKGTSIGFVLIANAWDDNGNYYFFQPEKNKYYSNANLNPESSSLEKTFCYAL